MTDKLLFQPIQIGNMMLRNRIVMSPMATNFGTEKGDITDQQIAYYAERAKGGVGLIIAESTYVSVEGRGARNRAGMCDDAVIPQHRRLTSTVHSYGAKICAQLHHAGATANPAGIDQLPVGPSATNYFSLGEKDVGLLPHALFIPEIEHLIECYAQAAKRVLQCNYDAVLIHCAHGYLLQEFLSPHTNKRTDKYGGSEENRMRFPLEVVAAVRKVVGPEFPIFVRVSAEETVDGGYDFEFIKRFALKLQEAGINEINFSCGNYEELDKIMPMPHAEDGCYVKYAAEAKKILSIVVSTVGRITSPEFAESILAEGKADLVYVGRAHVADPYWAMKAEHGGVIRPCIGCNIGCQERMVAGKQIRCAVNARVGIDNQVDVPPAESKRILTVGAGPAGCQFALEASQLGHQVLLIDRRNSIGGQLYYASKPPHKERLSVLMHYFAEALAESTAVVRLGTEYSQKIVDEFNPTDIVFATGAEEIRLRLPGASLSHVHMAASILDGEKVEGKRGVIIGGGEVGLETAEYLLEEDPDREITIIEMMDAVADKMGSIGKKMLLESLMSKGLNVLVNSSLKEIVEKGIVVERLDTTQKIPCDFVVMAVGYRPALIDCKAKVRTHIIGDSAKVANINEATASAYTLAHSI